MLAVDKMKRQLGRWLLHASASTRAFRALLAEIALNIQKFVADRSRPLPTAKATAQTASLSRLKATMTES